MRYSEITVVSKNYFLGTSLVVQWLGLCASTAGDMGSIPGRGTKIPQAMWHGQDVKNKKMRGDYI